MELLQTILAVGFILLTVKSLKSKGIDIKQDLGEIGSATYLEFRDLIVDKPTTKSK